MIVKCCRCKIIVTEEKKPVNDLSITHGVCDECKNIILEEIEQRRRKREAEKKIKSN